MVYIWLHFGESICAVSNMSHIRRDVSLVAGCLLTVLTPCSTLHTKLPLPAPATKLQPWWSYDVGLIHFVGMSTEHKYSTGSAQHEWLRRDLAAVNRTLTPWIIFTGALVLCGF
jgi:hypothetical protein